MEYFNSQSPAVENFSTRTLLEDYQFEKIAAARRPEVFLSHSSKDKHALPRAIGLIEQHGARVYIDKLDRELPEKTSPETGAQLKERIDECKKFIVLTSYHSKESRWIPWELGLADEKKKISNIALLPDSRDSSSNDWINQEYMGLYPRIVRHTFKGQTSPVWMVYDQHENNGTELSKWLKQ